MSTLDQSLDQISASRKTARRGARRGGRTVAGGAGASEAKAGSNNARARYSAGAVPAANGRAAPAAPTPAAAASAAAEASTKVLVSGLPFDVNEAQVKELFHGTVGPTREVVLTYDAKGNSKGIASITFTKRGLAQKAFSEYNGRLIDGKRPMKIEIIYDPSQPATLAQRVAPAPAQAAPKGPKAATAPAAGASGAASGPKAVRGRRGGRGGRGGAKKGPERPAKTAADLDAEMEDYSKTATDAAAAATA